MLSTRKSMSLMETVEGPFLIHFRYWFQTKFRQGSIIKIQFGKRPPNIIKNYVPGDKYIFIDIGTRSTMPICKVQTSDANVEIDLKKYHPGNLREHVINIGKSKLIFTFQLLSNASQIAAAYASDKIDEDEKYRYGESINDFIRSEAEFLSKFQKDIEVEEIKKVQKAESDRETELSAELLSIKSINFNLKSIIMIFILFLMIGYLVGSSEPQRKKNKKKFKKTKVK